MYLYVYAPFLRQKQYARELGIVEGQVTDFGIGGKIAQLSQFLKFPAAIKEFGAKRLITLVLVGDDALLEEAVNYLAFSEVALAYIPMTDSIYSQALSIPKGALAVQTLAARRINKLDLGQVEKKFFLGAISVKGQGIELHTPAFSIFPKDNAKFEVVNLGPGADATDGLLDVIVTPLSGSFRKKIGDSTCFKIKSCRLKSVKPAAANCGALGIIKTPFQIDIVPKAVKMIIGSRMRNEK